MEIENFLLDMENARRESQMQVLRDEQTHLEQQHREIMTQPHNAIKLEEVI